MTVAQLVPYTLGGSDAADICGVGHGTPLDVYLRKTDPERFAVQDNEAMEWGRELQDDIDAGVRRRGYDVTPFPADGARDKARPWLHGHPDGITVLQDEYAILECKTVGYWAHREWDGGVPLEYDCQCQVYMHLTGFPRALLAALVGGQRLELHTVERNERAIAMILRLMGEFHERLVKGIPPDPLAGDKDAMYAQYPSAEEGSVGRYTKAQMDTVYDLRLLKEARGKIDAQIEEKENVLKRAHGDRRLMVAPNDYEVSRWTPVTQSRFDKRRFERDHPALCSEYSTTTELRRFQLL